eukprot:SAG22_NODE_10046_length_556_cov_0.910284_1_plen_79_part_00
MVLQDRNLACAEAFKAIDTDGTGVLTRGEIEKYVRTHLVRGREDYAGAQEDGGAEVYDGQDAVDKLMVSLPPWRNTSG